MNYKYILVMLIAVTGQCFAMGKGREGFPGGCLRSSQENELTMFAISKAQSKKNGDERFYEEFYKDYLTALAQKQTQQDREENGEDEA